MSEGLVQIIDTCVLINLLATECLEDILKATSHSSVICSAVSTEALYLRADDPNDPHQPVDLNPLIESGILTVCEVEGEAEEVLYVDYAGVLDDGEAMSVALALSRGFWLATDERKARRLFIEATGDPGRLISTSQLIRDWAEVRAIPSSELGRVLSIVQSRARYQPAANNDPNYQWWIDSCR